MESEASPKSGWARARELFLDLVDLGEAERERELAELDTAAPEMAAWVRRLLAHDLGPDAAEPEPALTFGPYRTVERIGAGGMGEVYLARRSDGEFEREVAVKRLRPGAASEALVQRFLRERQTLARLDHPFIARLIDGGKTESGQPFLVLEYVRGRHIDEYCRQEQLDVRARVQLLRQVLEAVQYAHERGVVHRDLKPSNILVRDDGQPRLLDFGIARTAVDQAALGPLTGTGERLFTPGFASPEQVRGEMASEASDVFALGVILYELLAGVGPWEGAGSLHALERSILECAPRPPSRRCEGRMRKLLAGDLDTIVLRCLEERPSARFGSVQELSMELDRYLRGYPIRTRPTAPWVRLARHARRSPWAAAAWLLFLFSIVAVGLAWRAQQTSADRGVELAESLHVSLEQARSLSSEDLNAEAVEELRSLLEKLESVPGELELRLEAMAELAHTLNRVQASAEALEWVEASADLLPDDPALFVRPRARFLLAALAAHNLLSHTESAAAASDRAYDYALEWLSPGDPLRLEAIEGYAVGSAWLSLEERIAALEEGVLEAREYGSANRSGLGSLQLLRGFLLVDTGRYDEALKCIDESLEIDRWNHGESHGDVALSRQVRGMVLIQMERLPEARVELEAALPVFETNGHTQMAAGTRRQLGELKAMQGEYDAALEDLIEAHAEHAELLGPDSETCQWIEALVEEVEGKLANEANEGG